MAATLNLIRDALKAVDVNVFYGIASQLPKDAPWNYTVFSRDTTDPTEKRTGYTDRYIVSVVREDYIPEGLFDEVVEAVEGIPGMRFSAQGAEYVYDVMPGTSDTAEMMVVRFAKPRKRK